MPIPFLLLGAAALLGGVGVAAGVGGKQDHARAKHLARTAERRASAANAHLEKVNVATSDALTAHAARVQAIVEGPHQRFGDLVRALQARGMAGDLRCVDGVTVAPARLARGGGITLDALTVASGAAQGALTGAAAGSATFGLVSAFGTASTGTAIAGLSGVAAESATLAWLGGGSLAAGGGGVALGTTVLGGVVAAPVLLFGGLAMANAGAEALTAAHRHAARIDGEVARVEVATTLLGAIRARVGELGEVASGLAGLLTQALSDLDARTFEPRDARHARALSVATTLWSALDEVLRTPAFDADGETTLASAEVVLRFRELSTRGVA